MGSDFKIKSPLSIVTGQQPAPLQELIASMALILKKRIEELPLAENLKDSITPYYNALDDSNLPTKELAIMTLLTITSNKMLTPYDKF